MTIEPLLSIEEVAAWLRVPKKTVYMWRTRGYGPRGMKVGKYLRYRREDVESWIEEQRS